MKIELKNNNIMVRELIVKEDQTTSKGGIIIPEEILEEDQVAQGTVVNSSIEGYNNGDILLFHKVMPVNARMKLDGSDKLEEFFFIKEQDVICRLSNE